MHGKCTELVSVREEEVLMEEINLQERETETNLR